VSDAPTSQAYKIERELGRGGMGVVYLARDVRLGRQVAIKTFPPAPGATPEDLHRRAERFRREAQMLARLNHPNIAAIYDIIEQSGSVSLVMEFVDGSTLLDRLTQQTSTAMGVGLAESVDIAAEIAGALVAAHEAGIVHGDLKPANIKITPRGAVKVLDFGLARGGSATHTLASAVPDDVPTQSFAASDIDQLVAGTPGYMSPEMARGQAVDARADIFALGCVLFELLSGKRAFPGKTSGEIMAAVLLQDPDYTQLPAGTPESLQRLIARCLAKEPVKRPASATEVLQTLKKVVRAPSLDTGRRGGGWLEDADASENPLDIPPSISVAAAAPAEAHRSVVTSKPPAAAGSAPGSPQSSASGETEPPARRGDTVHLTELAPGSGAPAKHVSQLEPALLNVLVQCACFAGSFAARDAVEVLGNTAGTASVLARLSECGLLGHENAGENERLFVPSALRAYIQQLYRDDEALAGAHRRLINHLALWSVRMRKLMEGPAQARSLQEIDACVDTIAGSLAWSQATGECAEDAVLVVANLREYWEVRGRVGYARTTLERALDRGHLRLSPLTQALGLSSSGALAHIEGDMVEAVTLQRKALAQMRKLGEEEGTAECLLLLGVALILKEPLTSRNMLQEAIDLGNKLDRRDFVARGCLGLSFLALQSASMIDAQRALLAVSTVKGAGGSTSAQSAFSPRLSAQIQTMWGFLKLLQNEPSEAERLVNEGLALLTQIDDQPGIGLAHCQLGKIDLHNRQLDKAEAQLESGLAILRTVRDKLGVLRALGAKAHLMGERGHHRDALTLWLACERVRTEIMLPISPAESLLNQRWLARTVQALGETGVKAAEKAAAAMTWLQMNE